MATIEVTTRDGEAHAVEAQFGVSVMEIIRNAGFDDMLALCGGSCACATCHIYVDEAFQSRLPPMNEDENELLDISSHRTAASRLSCQIPFEPNIDGLKVSITPED